MPGKPTPKHLAMLLCDYLVLDAETHNKSLIGIFNRVNASKFPVRHDRMHVFVALTDGHGEYGASLRIKSSAGKQLLSLDGKVDMRDPLGVAEINFNIRGLVRAAATRPGLRPPRKPWGTAEASVSLRAARQPAHFPGTALPCRPPTAVAADARAVYASGGREAAAFKGMVMPAAAREGSSGNQLVEHQRPSLENSFLGLFLFGLGSAMLIGAVLVFIRPPGGPPEDAPGLFFRVFRWLWKDWWSAFGYGLVVPGAIVGPVGLAILLIKTSQTLDRESFTITFRVGLRTPFGPVTVYRRAEELNWPEAVVAGRKKPDKEDDFGKLFEVAVRCAGGEEVGTTPTSSSDDTADYVAAHARRVAAFLDLDYVDEKTEDDVRTYAPSPVPLPRELRRGGAPPAPKPPESTRIQFNRSGGGVSFETPRLKSRPRGALVFMLSAIIPAGAAFALAHVPEVREALGALGPWLLGACALTVFGLMGLMLTAPTGRATSQETVSASPEGIRVERRTLFGSRTFEARAEDVIRVGIERLRVDPQSPPAVIVEAGNGATYFGATLGREELEWLVVEVKRALLGLA
ncbi:MAG: DUF6941 family protein [Planctomycetota bacterium]|jgi:hypothetical protein